MKSTSKSARTKENTSAPTVWKRPTQIERTPSSRPMNRRTDQNASKTETPTAVMTETSKIDMVLHTVGEQQKVTSTSAVVGDQQSKNKMRAKKLRRKSENFERTKSSTELAGGRSSNNEQRPYKNVVNVAYKQAEDGNDDSELWRLLRKPRKQRVGDTIDVPETRLRNANKCLDKTGKESPMLKSGGNADCKPANSTNGSRGDFVRNSRTRNETEQRKGVEKVAGEQQKDADDDSERWKIIEKSRKQRDDRSKYVPSAAKEQSSTTNNQPTPGEKNSSCTKNAECKKQSAIITKKAFPKLSSRVIQCSPLEKLNKRARWILRDITTENVATVAKEFAALPIDTMELLDNIVQLVFEKAIQNRYLAPAFATLCASLRCIQVHCAENKTTTSFTSHILRKCKKEFEANKVHRTDCVKKLEEINACEDPKEKKTLEVKLNEIRRRMRNRLVGNCWFIGELFIKRILKPGVVMYCITDLIGQRTETSLECLCNLLMTVGMELESCCDLNETFEKLKTLQFDRRIFWRMRCRIRNVMDSRKNKWSPHV